MHHNDALIVYISIKETLILQRHIIPGMNFCGLFPSKVLFLLIVEGVIIWNCNKGGTSSNK